MVLKRIVEMVDEYNNFSVSQLKIYSLVPSQPHPVLAVSMLGPEYTHSPVK